ncbi:MAG: acyl carrier protein [Kofleriaceae bacterium]
MIRSTESHVRSVLERLVCQRLAVTPEQLTADASFIRDLGADSLDMIDLILALETELKVRISESEVPNLATVGAALARLCELVEAGPRPAAAPSASEHAV